MTSANELSRRAARLLDCPSPPPTTPLAEMVARHHETGLLWRRRRSGGEWLIDIDDDATRGYLLGRVRKAWGLPGMRPELHDAIWIIRDGSGELIEGPSGTAFFSEVEALVTALEAKTP